MSMEETSPPIDPKPEEDESDPPPLALIPHLQAQRKLTIVSPSLDQILRSRPSTLVKDIDINERSGDYLPALAEAVTIREGVKQSSVTPVSDTTKSTDAIASTSFYSDHGSLFQPMPQGQEIILGTDTDTVEVVIGDASGHRSSPAPMLELGDDTDMYENMVVGPTMTKLVAAAQCQDSDVTILGSTEFEISLYVPSVEVSTKLIKDFQTETGYKFAIAKARRTFGQQVPDISVKAHRILWRDLQDGKRDPQIEFDGIPFIVLGEKRLDCEHGKKVKKAGEKKINTELAKIESLDPSMDLTLGETGIVTTAFQSASTEELEMPPVKKRRSVMSKKFDCPAKICLRDIARFPDYKVKADTDHHRLVASKRLRKDMEAGVPINWDRRIYIRLPTELRHQCHAIRGFRKRKKKKRKGKTIE